MQQHKDERGRGEAHQEYHQDHIWTISLVYFPDNI